MFRIFDWLGKHELGTLNLLAGFMAAIWVFAELADEVLEKETDWFDRAVFMALRNDADVTDPIGPLWFEEMCRDITALGSLSVVTLISLSVIGYLLLAHRKHLAMLAFSAVSIGAAISFLLKALFDRGRPEVTLHETIVYTTGFPSGHAMVSAIVYLGLAALLIHFQKKRRIKAYIFLLAVVITLLVGMTRVYLGVHWPTDVFAGWAAGAAWALFCWLVADWLQARGKL